MIAAILRSHDNFYLTYINEHFPVWNKVICFFWGVEGNSQNVYFGDAVSLQIGLIQTTKGEK